MWLWRPHASSSILLHWWTIAPRLQCQVLLTVRSEGLHIACGEESGIAQHRRVLRNFYIVHASNRLHWRSCQRHVAINFGCCNIFTLFSTCFDIIFSSSFWNVVEALFLEVIYCWGDILRLCFLFYIKYMSSILLHVWRFLWFSDWRTFVLQKCIICEELSEHNSVKMALFW